MTANQRVVIFGIHRTSDWWRYVGRNLGLGEAVVVTDLRNEGDVSVVTDFYRELHQLRRASTPSSNLLSESETADVIARCRTLRWMDLGLAWAMTHAMAIVLDRVLETFRPAVVMSFPIDRYVKDVFARRAAVRGIPYVELTAAVFPGMSMLLRRGTLVESSHPPDPALLETKRYELISPAFLPSYVPRKSTFSAARFIRTLAYFRARALAFRAIGMLRRDPLNLHYLDAQPALGHKCRWKDIRVVRLVNCNWRARLDGFPREKRVFFGLQLFPEASIDYWIRRLDLIEHENLIIQVAGAFSEAGYLILVKDHPLQFGFRHTDLLQRLLELENVVLLPYEVSGNEVLTLSGVNFTCTGTLGLQSALAGLKSVVTDSYYTNDRDFILFRSRDELAALPARVEATAFEASLEQRQSRIVEKLLRGSFDGEIYSFKQFDAKRPSVAALRLGQVLGRRLGELLDEKRI